MCSCRSCCLMTICITSSWTTPISRVSTVCGVQTLLTLSDDGHICSKKSEVLNVAQKDELQLLMKQIAFARCNSVREVIWVSSLLWGDPLMLPSLHSILSVTIFQCLKFSILHSWGSEYGNQSCPFGALINRKVKIIKERYRGARQKVQGSTKGTEKQYIRYIEET